MLYPDNVCRPDAHRCCRGTVEAVEDPVGEDLVEDRPAELELFVLLLLLLLLTKKLVSTYGRVSIRSLRKSTSTVTKVKDGKTSAPPHRLVC